MSNGTGTGVIPAKRGQSRVWLIEGRSRPDHQPAFKSQFAAGGITKSKGDITPIFQPSPQRYNQFLQVGSFRGGEERPTIDLTGHFPFKLKSDMLRLIQQDCPFDIQLHIGECEDPTDFNNGFQKVIILEDAGLTEYSTDEIGSLQPDDVSQVDETGAISAARIYEFLIPSVQQRSPTVVNNELLDVVICDNVSCGDCEDESNGCTKIYAISLAAGGSPSTPADVVFSLDKGVTWNAHDVDTLGVADDPSAIACVGVYIVVTSNDSGSYHIALKSEFDSGADPAFSEVTNGFVAGGEPNDIWSVGNKAFIVGDFGFVYTTTDAPAGVTAIDSGEATISNLNAVHALNENFAVAVGNDGTVLIIENDLVSRLETPPVGLGVNLDTVWLKNDKEWFVGTNGGELYYTLNAGQTWTSKALGGTTPSAITDISMSSESVMYVAATVGGKGLLYTSIDGGFDFNFLPPQSVGNIQGNDRINAIATCSISVDVASVDFVVGVGLGDDAADGFIVVAD